MDNELDYIISAYASLKLSGSGTNVSSPLKDVSLNHSPSRLSKVSPHKRNSAIIKSSPTEISKLCWSALELGLSKMPKNYESKSLIRLVSSAFQQLYKVEEGEHRSKLVRKHQSCIVRFIELESKNRTLAFKNSLNEIRSLYLNIEENEPLDTEPYEILGLKTSLTLKFFILQILLKRFQHRKYDHAELLLSFFRNCTNGPTLADSQKNSLIKLSLAFTKFAPSPQFKLCMNLKFLQLLDQSDFKFRDYISNMTREEFVADMESSIFALEDAGKIPFFLFDFSMNDNTQSMTKLIEYYQKSLSTSPFYHSIQWSLINPSTNSSKSLLKLLSMQNASRSLIWSELSSIGKPNAAMLQGLGEFIIGNLPDPDPELGLIIEYYIVNTRQLNKTTLETLDKFVVYSKCFLEFPDVIEKTFSLLAFLFLKHEQLKRLKNITNLYYNFSLKVTQKSIIKKFILKCLEIEAQIFITSSKHSDLHVKFDKAIKMLVSQNLAIGDTFRVVFNNAFLSHLSFPNWFQKLDFITEKFGSKFAFQNPCQLPVGDLSEENRTIVFVLAAKHSRNELGELLEKLSIETPLLRMICGIYFQDIPLIKISPSKPAVSNTNISPTLIKSFYYLVQEIKTNSTHNIKKIFQLYKGCCVSCNQKELTSFEFHFLVKLVEYLRFINFQKLLKVLLDTIEHYKSFGRKDFNDWFTFCAIENRIMSGDMQPHLLNEIDSQASRTDFSTLVDQVLHMLEYQLLKLKYHLYNYDQVKLIQSAAEINYVLQEHSNELNIENKNGYSKEKFMAVIVLLIKLHYYRAKAVSLLGDHLESIASSCIAVQLSKSVLKQGFENLEVISLISSGFRSMIKSLIHLGISKDAEYYSEEFRKLNESLCRFKSSYAQNCYFLCYYQFIIGNLIECEEFKVKGNAAFNLLKLIRDDEYVDNFKLIYFSLVSNVYAQAEESVAETKQRLDKFFNFMDKDGRSFSVKWKQNYEYVFNAEVSIKHSPSPFIRSMDSMVQSRRLFVDAQNYLNIDPLFSTLEDSAMSIPSTFKEEDLLVSPPKKNLKNVKNVKRSIMNLKQSKKIILGLFDELRYLSNYHIDEMNKVLSLDLLTLSSISNSYKNESITDSYKLNDYTKNQPLVNEKSLVNVTSKPTVLSPDFNFKSLSYAANETDGTIDDKLLEKLPEDWLVVTIDVCSFNGDLIISKFQKQLDSPNYLRLPLSRHSSRTVDEESFSFSDAISELKLIIDHSNATTTKERTESIKTPEDRKQWHEERRELDEKLQSLLAKIEYCWLGGFKGILNQDIIPSDLVRQFKERFLMMIRQNIPSRAQRNPAIKPVQIDDFVIELFLRLGDPAKLMSTELLEDLIYFVLDIMSFHGEENAYDEIDIDNIYVQVESLINEHLIANPNPKKINHIVLVVGKECHSIPWESLPCLRNASTTRMPSLSFLLKLYDQNKMLVANKRNGAFLVNPSGDLYKSQERFEEHLNELSKNSNWDGMRGVKPSESEVEGFLTNSNVFVYIGHGGGEQYIRSTALKKLNRIAPTLLLGCSSAALKDCNLLEPSGTIYSYLLGGCPMILGNLWDVTDKDIDKFSLSVFEKWGLVGDGTRATNICDAVRQSREACNLRYLNGAAPVVYGLPLSLL